MFVEKELAPKPPPSDLALSFSIHPYLESVFKGVSSTILSSFGDKIVRIEKMFNKKILARFMKRWRYFKLIYPFDAQKSTPQLVYHGTGKKNSRFIPPLCLLSFFFFLLSDYVMGMTLGRLGIGNKDSIMEKGLLIGGRQIKRANANIYGTGIYCSPLPRVALSYARTTPKCVFVCAALLGRQNRGYMLLLYPVALLSI